MTCVCGVLEVMRLSSSGTKSFITTKSEAHLRKGRRDSKFGECLPEGVRSLPSKFWLSTIGGTQKLQKFENLVYLSIYIYINRRSVTDLIPSTSGNEGFRIINRRSEKSNQISSLGFISLHIGEFPRIVVPDTLGFKKLCI